MSGLEMSKLTVNDQKVIKSYCVRTQLQNNNALQKLYEKCYFDNYDLAYEVFTFLKFHKPEEARAIERVNNPEERKINYFDFKTLIQRDLKSISPDDFDDLVLGCPRIKADAPVHPIDFSNIRVMTSEEKENMIKDRENHRTYILYHVLNQEIIELIDQDLPISSIYDKFKVRGYPVRS